MGPGIIIPVAVLAVAIPVTLGVTRRRFKQVAAGIGPDLGHATDPAVRLTSNALRVLGTPPWRVVHEIARQRLGGIDHVVIGPPGVLPIMTTIEPLPSAPSEGEHDPAAVAEAAVLRGDVDSFGVRASGSAATYAMWIFVLTGVPLATWTLIRRRDFPAYIRRQ